MDVADIVHLVTDEPLDLRPFTADEMDQAHDLISLGFGGENAPADRKAEESVFEFDRSLAAFDGNRLVAMMGTYSFDMSVPGASLPLAGTTWVAVSPTHRRRGLLRRMMSAHLEGIRERGEPLAGLWASEPAIYGRFGYGPAIEQQHMSVAVDGDLRWAATAPAPVDVTFVPLADAPAVLDPIYEACRVRRAGTHGRNEAWWRFNLLSSRPNALGGMNQKYVALAHVDGRPAAYAVYGLKGSFGRGGRPDGAMRVFEIAGIDASAEGALWRFLLAHDLTSTVVVPHSPVDDVLPLLLTDSRRVTRTLGDALHLRVMDVAAALQGRTYLGSTAFTVEIVDDVVEANDGVWSVEVAPEGSLVEPVADVTTPDLRMPIASLGAMYMGDLSVRRLAAAGLIEVTNPDVVAPTDAAFTAVETGWVPEVW